MLSVTLKLLSIISKYLFKHGRSDYRLITVPHLIKELSIGLNQSALGAKRVVFI
jgi:hypothetical protein